MKLLNVVAFKKRDLFIIFLVLAAIAMSYRPDKNDDDKPEKKQNIEQSNYNK